MIVENNIETLKVILLGNKRVGKTTIINQYINNEFDPSLQTTIGVSFCNSLVEYEDGKKIELEIWDSGRQER